MSFILGTPNATAAVAFRNEKKNTFISLVNHIFCSSSLFLSFSYRNSSRSTDNDHDAYSSAIRCAGSKKK